MENYYTRWSSAGFVNLKSMADLPCKTSYADSRKFPGYWWMRISLREPSCLSLNSLSMNIQIYRSCRAASVLRWWKDYFGCRKSFFGKNYFIKNNNAKILRSKDFSFFPLEFSYNLFFSVYHKLDWILLMAKSCLGQHAGGRRNALRRSREIGKDMWGPNRQV